MRDHGKIKCSSRKVSHETEHGRLREEWSHLQPRGGAALSADVGPFTELSILIIRQLSGSWTDMTCSPCDILPMPSQRSN